MAQRSHAVDAEEPVSHAQQPRGRRYPVGGGLGLVRVRVRVRVRVSRDAVGGGLGLPRALGGVWEM